MNVVGFGLVLPAATCDLQLDTLRMGMLSSFPYLGVALSSHAWGFFCDFKGRRRTILISLANSVTLSVASALSPNFYIVVVLRFICGLR